MSFYYVMDAKREYYIKKMEPLLAKSETLDAGNIKINVGFTKYGNKHLYSDTFGRSSVLLRKDLASLDKLLMKAEFLSDAPLIHLRVDKIEHFYYFKAYLHGRLIRLNVAKQVWTKTNGKKETKYFLYSINDII